MKVLIPILIGSLIVGCEKRLSKEDVIGKYESDGPKANVDIAGKKIFEYRMDLLKGGTCVHFMDDEINFEGRWEIKGNEIHQISGGMVAIYRVNPDKSLTNVESKLGEMLIKIPEDIQYTYTKIYRETNKTPSKNVGKSWTKAKSEPVKEFTLRKKVIGAYEL